MMARFERDLLVVITILRSADDFQPKSPMVSQSVPQSRVRRLLIEYVAIALSRIDRDAS